MFKIIISFILLFFTSQIFAADYSAIGNNAIGQLITLEESAEGLQINVYVKKKLSLKHKPKRSNWPAYENKPVESYLFQTECPNWNWKATGQETMSCLKTGKSPLATAEYIKWMPKNKKDTCGGPATFLKCVKGCTNSRVAKILEELPYECE